MKILKAQRALIASLAMCLGTFVFAFAAAPQAHADKGVVAAPLPPAAISGPGSDWILGDWEVSDGCGEWFRYQSFRREGASIGHYASESSPSNLSDGGWEITGYDQRSQTWTGPGWSLRPRGDALIVQHEATCTWVRAGSTSTPRANSTLPAQGAWSTARVASEAGRWLSGRAAPARPAGFYMVANANSGHAGYIGMGSIVRIESCDTINCQVDILYGYGSNACDNWYIVPDNLTYLGPSYQNTWQSVSDQLYPRDPNRSALAQRCAPT